MSSLGMDDTHQMYILLSFQQSSSDKASWCMELLLRYITLISVSTKKTNMEKRFLRKKLCKALLDDDDYSFNNDKI